MPFKEAYNYYKEASNDIDKRANLVSEAKRQNDFSFSVCEKINVIESKKVNYFGTEFELKTIKNLRVIEDDFIHIGSISNSKHSQTFYMTRLAFDNNEHEINLMFMGDKLNISKGHRLSITFIKFRDHWLPNFIKNETNFHNFFTSKRGYSISKDDYDLDGFVDLYQRELVMDNKELKSTIKKIGFQQNMAVLLVIATVFFIMINLIPNDKVFSIIIAVIVGLLISIVVVPLISKIFSLKFQGKKYSASKFFSILSDEYKNLFI